MIFHINKATSQDVVRVTVAPDRKKEGEYIGFDTSKNIYFLAWGKGFDYKGIRQRFAKVQRLKEVRKPTKDFGGHYTALVLQISDDWDDIE